MTAPRTNTDWLRDLRTDGEAQAPAIEELRTYLLRSLPGCLGRHGSLPPAVLEDVVQDALVQTLDRLDQFEGRSGFKTWATTIAVRMAMNELRRRRWRDVPLEELLHGDALTPDGYADPAASPESQAARREILRVMQELIENALSDRQRVAILAESGGMPQEEIGRHLGINRNAVYKLGHDARKKLKSGMEASGLDGSAIRAAFS